MTGQARDAAKTLVQTHTPKVTVVEVGPLAPLTEHWYSRVVLVIDGEEYEMSGPDAQCIGHALNNAGGGVLDA